MHHLAKLLKTSPARARRILLRYRPDLTLLQRSSVLGLLTDDDALFSPLERAEALFPRPVLTFAPHHTSPLPHFTLEVHHHERRPPQDYLSALSAAGWQVTDTDRLHQCLTIERLGLRLPTAAVGNQRVAALMLEHLRSHAPGQILHQDPPQMA